MKFICYTTPPWSDTGHRPPRLMEGKWFHQAHPHPLRCAIRQASVADEFPPALTSFGEPQKALSHIGDNLCKYLSQCLTEILSCICRQGRFSASGPIWFEKQETTR